MIWYFALQREKRSEHAEKYRGNKERHVNGKSLEPSEVIADKSDRCNKRLRHRIDDSKQNALFVPDKYPAEYCPNEHANHYNIKQELDTRRYYI